MKRLAGKTALITGGNSGIGYESARAFIAEGAQVFLTGRDQEKINKAVAELGPQATGFQSDAGKISGIATLVEQVEPLVDGLDILFANAGIGRATPLGSTSEEVIDEIFAVSVKGLFLHCARLPAAIAERRFRHSECLRWRI
jgi:NAD(P)-dependent dehydrogenase (short-subunit alcohol dehydrogenase family)